MLDTIARALDLDEKRWLLAGRGRLGGAVEAAAVEARFARFVDAEALVVLAAEEPRLLARAFAVVRPGARWPGRAEALLAVARALGRRLPESEYALPEDSLEALVARARALVGRRLPLRGAPGHKGRAGDAVERLLLGRANREAGRGGRGRDHPAAEVKSVPVRGDRVLERVKLGVVSPTSNPLAKCDRVLFVFVEERGDDRFVRGIGVAEFDDARWRAMWERGDVVETAAGQSGGGARGLYLVPRWFREAGLWPARDRDRRSPS
jgi:hypothetical protein